MTNLTSKFESFIATMKQGEEFARHGFELLAKRPEPEQYFDPLIEAGFFDAPKNFGPVASREPGFVQIPYWSALNYLEAIAKRAGQLDSEQLADKLLKIIRDVTNFRDPNGEARDNYHTYHKFAEMLGVLPLSGITRDDIYLAKVWLSSRYDHGLVATALSKGLLCKLLASGGPEDIDRACVLMNEFMDFKWLDERNQRGHDLVTIIDDHWLKRIIDKYAAELGAKAGLPAIKIFENGVRAIFSDTRRGYGSTLWRPAIENSAQNSTFRGAENRFVEGLRDALSGWIEAKPDDALPYVRSALKDDEEIIRRIAIHTVTEYFELLREPFESVITEKLFSSGHRHELYRLLEMRFEALTPSGKEKVIAAIHALPQPKSGDEPERRLKYTQREWLISIKDQPEATAWFAELAADPTLGRPTDHPEFLSYHEMRTGPGPTPFGEDSLVAFAEDGTIVDRLNAFQETDGWKGPTLGGLVSALEFAVAGSPNTFLPLLSDFHRAKIPFQHALIEGFKRAYDPSNAKKAEFDWANAWPKLLTFFAECLGDEELWASTAEENGNLVPTRSWMTTLFASFLEAGTKDDDTAYPPELLPSGWELIKTLLARSTSEKPDLTDPMTHALNTGKGRVIGAMYSHALRVCRAARKSGGALEEAWATLKPVFDSEIAMCRGANFEFSTLSASNIAQLDFMSHDWLVENIRRIFPAEFPANFEAALGGLAFARPTRVLFKLLSSSKILDLGLNTKPEDRLSRQRIVEWICLAYLWGDEALDTPLMTKIFSGGIDDLQNAAEFFWTVREEKLTPEQTERVLAFWAKCLDWAKAQREVPVRLLSRLGRLASYLATLDERANELLVGVVPFVHTDYSTDQMIEELSRFADTNPAATVDLLERMFEAGTPNYDMDDKLKHLLHKLANMGYRAAVLRCIEKLRKTLPGMLEFYKQVIAEAPTC